MKVNQHPLLFLGGLSIFNGIRIKDWFISINVHSSVILRNQFTVNHLDKQNFWHCMFVPQFHDYKTEFI